MVGTPDEDESQATIEEEQEADEAVSEGVSIWTLRADERGFAAEKEFGGNLPYGFPVIDAFENEVVTSIKSIDVTAPSYQEGNTLLNTLKGYIRKLSSFQSGARGNVKITSCDYKIKVLNIAIQPGKPSTAQFNQIGQAMQYGKANGISVIVSYVK